ncbi:uncharacterized protein LOC127796244 isoform X2 [Diospyros lotus]|uniref:uncharacterized protein LOC127796244 isoform X2 n=1 Tax=Diospyros lotus TaxID=55363 RepID=UPI00225B9F47|nr:uncharacterized protein LOC127796244 isoform X2 [Diospyros lotus]
MYVCTYVCMNMMLGLLVELHCSREGYANPLRLLPSKEPEVCRGSSLENVLQSFKVGGSECLYKVKLQTSNTYGSGLSDINAGILLCLIDAKGDSILQRIPASLIKDHSNQLEDNYVSDEALHFHRGSIDEFIFEGPKLGKLSSLWISLESGQWRLGGVGLIALCCNELTSEANDRNIEYFVSEYRFEVEDTLLGEGSDISMAELRPCLVKEFSGDNLNVLSENFLQPTTLVASSGSSNEESMKKYAELKLSLLLYDALLVLAGSSVASFSAGENAAVAFLCGGIGGFLYLFLLQRSVDGLPAPALTSMKNLGKSDQIFRKGPLWSLVLAFTLSVVAVKYGSGGGVTPALTPKELLSGMLGFLASKVAVVLAALKPLPTGLEQNK